MTKIKAILFDIDNTLIDFMSMKKKSCESGVDAMIGAGLKMKKEDVLKEIYELYEKKGMEYQTVFQEFLKKKFGKVNYRILARGIIAYRKIKETYLFPYPNVRPTLIKLKKDYKLAVVSDAPRIPAWMRLVSMGIDDFFDVVITKAEARRQKTHAAPFRAALRELKIAPEEAVMIGDRISRDIDTAKKLGIHTVYARYGDMKPAEPGKSGADFEVSDISEIVEVVKNLD